MILDTNLVISRIRRRGTVEESITIITLIEYPSVMEYAGFKGDVIFPTVKDYFLAYDIQRRLMLKGRMKGFADILIASIAINNGEELITDDKDFKDIAEVSSLKLKMLS